MLTNIMVSLFAAVLMFGAITFLMNYLSGRDKSRPVWVRDGSEYVNTSTKERKNLEGRFDTKSIKDVKNDLNRTGTWKVTFKDGKTCTRLGLLDNSLEVCRYEGTPVVSYKEI